jgi:hypothetical protein
MGFRRARVILIALAAPALVAIVASAALAQQNKAPTPKSHPTARTPAPKKSGAGDAGASGSGAFGSSVVAQPGPTVPGASSADAGYVEAKGTDGGGTHVFKFSELDIEGRLKSPQLVYFLRRVRAEFASGDLGHRSFMREMSETRKESSF